MKKQIILSFSADKQTKDKVESFTRLSGISKSLLMRVAIKEFFKNLTNEEAIDKVIKSLQGE